MVARTWVHLLVLLLTTAALAGCTNRDDGAGDGGTPTPGGGGSGGGGSTAAPDDFLLEDSGSISGPFSESWEIVVENVGFTSAMVHFGLTGAQAGAPPTARVNLVLTDPEGGVVKSATLGLGGGGDSVEWSLTPGELPTAGTYTLSASSGSEGAVPSVGIANYELMAMVEY